VGSWLGQRILEALKFIAQDLQGAFAQTLWTSFTKLYFSPVVALEDPTVQFLIRLAMTIALGCLPVLITYQAMRRVLESMDGTSVTPPEVLVRRSLNAGIALTGIALYGWFASTLADYGRELLGALPYNLSFLETFFFSDDPKATLAVWCLALVFLVCAGLVLVQRAILGAEFAVLMIIGAFLALQKVADDSPQGWQVWKREVTAICLTPVLQLLLLYLFAQRMSDGTTASLGRWLEAFAMLYLLWNTPRWARQFTYSTGVGHTVAGAGSAATRLVAIRMMLKK
jgi:hypothetical protein